MNREAPPPQKCLAAMFFLQNLVWGAQVVLLSGHMAALGAILSPLIGGWLADRFLPGQVFAGICYLLCSPVLWLAWGQTEFLPLLAAMFVFSVLHMPTAAVTNAIAFTHLSDTRLFGRARVWGSIGWVGISWSLSAYLRLWEGWNPAQSHLGDGLLVAAVLALVMGLYCFFLPSTPPFVAVATHWPFSRRLCCCANAILRCYLARLFWCR
ncbi:MAG: MFS transporter [Candidatus Latescibacterota bacterium]